MNRHRSRETHKVALIYIAEGQDEKNAILSNEYGSPDYEEFLSMLAWTVSLKNIFLSSQAYVLFIEVRQLGY